MEDILKLNRTAWDSLVEGGNRWTVPVSSEAIADARKGEWSIVLTPTRPVPADWFPDLDGVEVLCLASGGGQQAPILAAAGASVTVFDNSPKQLEQDRMVADRDGLDLRLVEGDMRNLEALSDGSFDLIVHPISNCFVPDIQPVWNECARVLRDGGDLLAGFTNPVRYLFPDDLEHTSDLLCVAHRIPYSDLEQRTEEEQAALREKGEPFEFGHSLSDQLAGQMRAGLVLVDLYEDDYLPEEDVLSRHIKTFVATRARFIGR
jgi:SAM-dependent methyltransferase